MLQGNKKPYAHSRLVSPQGFKDRPRYLVAAGHQLAVEQDRIPHKLDGVPLASDEARHLYLENYSLLAVSCIEGSGDLAGLPGF